MNLQVLLDSNGKNSGVYIPPKDWELIKQNYPDIENISTDLQPWQNEILDQRLEHIKNNPERLKPIEELYKILAQKSDEL